MPLYIGKERVSPVIVKDSGSGADYKSSLMATATKSAYSPSIVSLSDYVLPNYTIEKGQTGLLYPKRTIQPDETENFTKVGDVVIEDKVASGFSPSSYIKIPKQFSIGGSPFLIQMCFEHTSDQSTYVLAGSENSTIAISTQKGGCWFSLDGGTYNLNLSHKDKPFELNKKTWLQVERVNNTFWEVRRSYDGEEWESLTTANVSFNFLNISNLNIGFYGYEPTLSFIGKVYLDECFINVSGKPFWQPYETTNEYSLNVPDLSHGFKYSSMSLDGLTYTNNILKNTTYSSAGRIVTGVKLNVSVDDSWEWCVRFKQTAKGGAQYIMNHDYYKTGPYLAFDSTNTLLFTVYDGSSYVASGSMTELELNTWYTVRVGSTGNSYFMQCKKDGEEWSDVSCHNATNLVALSPTTEIRIGKPSHDGLLIGEWDFSQSYIKINGEMLWPNDEQKYKGICTKDFMPQAGTNTLNAYHIEYTDGTSECLLGQTEPTGEDIKTVQLLESGLTFEEDKAWTYNEDREQFE